MVPRLPVHEVLTSFQRQDISLVCYEDFLGLYDVRSVLSTPTNTRVEQVHSMMSTTKNGTCCECCDAWGEDDFAANDDLNDREHRRWSSGDSTAGDVEYRAHEVEGVTEGVTQGQCPLCCNVKILVKDDVIDDTSDDGLNGMTQDEIGKFLEDSSTRVMCGKATRSMRAGVSWLGTFLLHLSLKCLLLG